MSLSHCRLPLPASMRASKPAFCHESNKGFAKFELRTWNTALATGRQGDRSFLVICHSISGSNSSFTDISSKDDQIEIFLNVVHDLSFQKCLSSIIHDFITKFGFCNVLSQLLDTSSSCLWSSIQINNLVSIILGTSAIFQLADNFFDNFKLSSEKHIFLRVHDIPVSF